MTESTYPKTSKKRSHHELSKDTNTEKTAHSKLKSNVEPSQCNGHPKKINKIDSKQVAKPYYTGPQRDFSRFLNYSGKATELERDRAIRGNPNYLPPAPTPFNPTLPYQKPRYTFDGTRATLPLLPQIRSESLESAAFTAQGYHPGSTITSVNRTYERLEILGDAYLEVIAIRLIYTKYPDLPAGRLSQRRELCIKNETLARYARLYGFSDRAKLPRSFNKQNNKLWTKTLGDIFEAYVAAVILSDPVQGFEAVETWLTILWEYELSRDQKGIEIQDIDEESKNTLKHEIAFKDTTIEYRETREPEMFRAQGQLKFHIGVYFTGWHWENECLGQGSGFNKVEAGLRAAANALKNPLLREIIRVKKESVASYTAAKEKGEEPPPFRSRSANSNDSEDKD